MCKCIQELRDFWAKGIYVQSKKEESLENSTQAIIVKILRAFCDKLPANQSIRPHALVNTI